METHILSKDEVYAIIKGKPLAYIQEPKFKKNFPNIYNDVLKWSFPEGFSWTQKLYHYFNDDRGFNLGKCECGNRCTFRSFSFGYQKHCSQKCAHSDENVMNKFISTSFRRFGTKYPSQSELCKEKHTQTCLDRYGKVSYSQTEEWRNKKEQTCLDRYGSISYSQTKEWKHKECETKRRNNTFHTSRIENNVSMWLEEQGYKYIYQYMSEQYPFKCDFYLPDYDLYIEIQGTWTHGKHPFDKTNVDDINKLELWSEKSKISKFYKMAIDVWTNRDVHKRSTAKENNLNYLEVFSNNLEDTIKVIKNKLNEMG